MRSGEFKSSLSPGYYIVTISVSHFSSVTESPINCTRILHYDYYRTTIDGVNATTTEKVNWYSCDGGCANIREDCCHPYTFVSEELTFDVGGQNVTQTVQVPLLLVLIQ